MIEITYVTWHKHVDVEPYRDNGPGLKAVFDNMFGGGENSTQKHLIRCDSNDRAVCEKQVTDFIAGVKAQKVPKADGALFSYSTWKFVRYEGWSFVPCNVCHNTGKVNTQIYRTETREL